MNLIKQYLVGFLHRSGSYVFTSTVFSRALSFLASWLAIQFIPNKELGVVLFSYNIISFIIPFSDLGLHQSLIRFSALLENKDDKNSIFIYVYKKGFAITVLVTILVFLIGQFFPFEFAKTGFYLSLLSLHLLPFFLMQIIKIQFRLNHNNKTFSFVDLTFNVILVILVLLLSYYFNATGYACAIIFAPILTSLLFFKKLNINFKIRHKLSITNFSFWKYGFFSSITGFVTSILFVIDIFLVGYLLKKPELVTAYRYISIIPISILFLPRMFMTTDFVTYTERIKNKSYIYNYIKSYVLLFTGISFLYCCFCYFFGNNLLSYFGKEFIEYSTSFLVLVFGTCGILMFRGLFGNLLSSIGKNEYNYYIGSIAILINCVSNYYLIPKYGIFGASITSASLMWFTAIFSTISFIYLYRKFLEE